MPRALLRVDDPPRGRSGGWLRFRRPAAVLRAHRPEEVPALLAEVEAAAAGGRWAVGFVTYEAAAGFDPALCTHRLPAGVPAAWFALFGAPEEAGPPVDGAGGESAFDDAAVDDTAVDDTAVDDTAVVGEAPRLVTTITDPDYRERIEAVRRAIARGDTYQANFTYRLRAHLPGVPAETLFARLCRAQRAPYAAFLDLGADEGGGRRAVCSVSPELFFRREGGRVECRPMKGTAPRGRTLAEDRAARDALRASAKERAENLMIVDMVRNDLGRVARPGSVRVPSLFDVERYDTVHQMTSTVVARSGAPLAELFAALFPCASVTGAPKVSTMEILTGLESTPRGVYTGALGWVAPGGTARFSVAIRTAWVESDPDGRSRIEYGTGGGVVWDSDPERELAETRTKAIALRRALDPAAAAGRDFELLETVLWTPRRGYVLLDRHLERLAESAEYFGFPAAAGEARAELARAAAGWAERRRVRLLCDRRGALRVESVPLGGDGSPRRGSRTVRVALAPTPVDSADPFLFHKTTRRAVYARALEEARRAGGAPGDRPIGDAILRNERGELTESTIANLVLDLGGRLVTPPIDCGLLAGTLRAVLLARGRIRERVLVPTDLGRARGVYLVSSVRGWRRAEVAPTARPR